MAAKKICFVYATEAEDMALYKDLSPHFALYARKGLLEVIDRDAVFQRHADAKKLADYINDSDITIPLISIHLLNDPECLDWLQKAIQSQKKIQPVLLQPCDWKSEDQFKVFESSILPANGESVLESLDDPGEKEKIFSLIALRVKSLVFPELSGISLKKGGSDLFYYILAALLLTMGGISAALLYASWKMGIGMALFAFLMFACAALFALKNVLFPTQIKIA